MIPMVLNRWWIKMSSLQTLCWCYQTLIPQKIIHSFLPKKPFKTFSNNLIRFPFDIPTKANQSEIFFAAQILIRTVFYIKQINYSWVTIHQKQKFFKWAQLFNYSRKSNDFLFKKISKSDRKGHRNKHSTHSSYFGKWKRKVFVHWQPLCA